MRCSVVIPARGGSKGIKRKNLQLVGGQSLVKRAVSHGLRVTGNVFVSTEDPEIAAEALHSGGKVIERPVVLASDEASSESALLHAIEEGGLQDDCIAFLQATSPFRTIGMLERAIETVISMEAEVCFSARESHPFLWTESSNGYVEPINHPKDFRPRRQELTRTFVETGNFYVFRASDFLEAKYRFFGRVMPIETTFIDSIDIDEQEDLQLAQALASSADFENGPG